MPYYQSYASYPWSQHCSALHLLMPGVLAVVTMTLRQWGKDSPTDLPSAEIIGASWLMVLGEARRGSSHL